MPFFCAARRIPPLVRPLLVKLEEEWKKNDGPCLWLIDSCMRPQIQNAPRDIAHKITDLTFTIQVVPDRLFFIDEIDNRQTYSFKEACFDYGDVDCTDGEVTDILGLVFCYSKRLDEAKKLKTLLDSYC